MYTNTLQGSTELTYNLKKRKGNKLQFIQVTSHTISSNTNKINIGTRIDGD